MSNSLPFVSVIVPAYNRPDGLRALLDALEEQSYPPYRFEVLVCDDGSEPPLAEQVPVKERPFSVRFSRGANAGPATARNRGLKEARGSLIAFTDDDCLPEPGWLEAAAEALARPGTYAVHGPTRSSTPPIAPFIHSVHIGREHGVATANFAVRKQQLLAVGGFDETFAVPYFEDEDLSRRLAARFGEIGWREEMVVVHPPRQAKIGGMWRHAAFAYYLPYMQRKHPGYWSGWLPAVRTRALVKGAVVAVGTIGPLVGLPALAVGWLGLLAWQVSRLRRILHEALKHGARVPLDAQLVFIAAEWTLDFTRWWAYRRGKRLQPKPAPAEELVLE